MSEFRAKRGLQSEAEAFRQLVEEGLLATETPDELKDRCAEAHEAGQTFGWIISHILEIHPKVFTIDLNRERLLVTMKNDHLIEWKRSTGKWTVTA